MKDKMDLAIGVALGSSIQIAIFVIPFVCLVGWCTGHHFYLNFEPFAVLVLTLAVIHAYFVSSDGQSHWLLGVLLVATYVLVRLQQALPGAAGHAVRPPASCLPFVLLVATHVVWGCCQRLSCPPTHRRAVLACAADSKPMLDGRDIVYEPAMHCCSC